MPSNSLFPEDLPEPLQFLYKSDALFHAVFKKHKFEGKDNYTQFLEEAVLAYAESRSEIFGQLTRREVERPPIQMKMLPAVDKAIKMVSAMVAYAYENDFGEIKVPVTTGERLLRILRGEEVV